MLLKCKKCHSSISFKEFYKQHMINRYRFKCPKCGAIHRASIFSIIFSALLFIFIFLYYSIWVFDLKVWLLLILFFLYIFFLEPFIMKYELKE